ncbi:MAG: hypothetical protein ACRD8Z_02055 [Nitrososphaeraceae archaeon]
MKSTSTIKFGSHPIAQSQEIVISLVIVVVASIIIGTNFLDTNVKAQTNGIIDSSLGKATTTQVIPEKYTSPTSSSHNSSTYEIQPSVSKGFSEGKNLESPLVINPSYTITNTTTTFESSILRPAINPKQLDVSVFVANNSGNNRWFRLPIVSALSMCQYII